MRRAILAFFLLACAAFGQQLTTISDHFNTASVITVKATAAVTFTTTDGYTILAGRQFTASTDSNGNLSIALPPNGGATPTGSYYQVSYTAPGISQHEIWIVPSSGSAVNLAAVRSLSPPSPSYVFAFSQMLPPANCVAGQDVQWNGAGWDCSAGGGGGAGGYSQSFTNATTVTVLGTSHGLGTSKLAVTVLDNESPPHIIQPEAVTIDPTTYNVTVYFGAATSGSVVLVGGGSAAAGGATRYAEVFSAAATVWSIPASTHGLGAGVFDVRCFDSSGDIVLPASVNIDASGNVTVDFLQAQAGKVVIE